MSVERTIRPEFLDRAADGGRQLVGVEIIDQRLLPHEFRWQRWTTVEAAAEGISTMQVRGAPLIGVSAAWALALAATHDASDAALASAGRLLVATRPTAVNLAWAVERVLAALGPVETAGRARRAIVEAEAITEEDVAACRAMGEHGVALIEAVAARHPGRPVQVMTHCNAGWLACVEWGTATAPIYVAHERGVPIHVWVSETRPRNQGAALTAWELGRAGVPHTLIVDNAAGHLMQRGMVDLVLTGADRVAADGSSANKIGTYLKALAAFDNDVPFHIVSPRSTFDRGASDGEAIPIEQRDAAEVLLVNGGPIAPPTTQAGNWGFDVTPPRLITSIVTEVGIVEPSVAAIDGLFATPADDS